jgi:hypothetical protein
VNKPVEVIILKETVLESWMTDAITFALFLALIGIGVLLGSVAMQWVGGIVGFIAIGSREKLKAHRMTIGEARAKLDSLESAAPTQVGAA